MNKTIFTIVIAVGFGILPGQLSISQGMDVKTTEQPELEKILPPIEQSELVLGRGGPPKKTPVLRKGVRVYDENTVFKIDDEGNTYTGISLKELRELEISRTQATPIRDDEKGFIFSFEDTQTPIQEPEQNTIKAIHDEKIASMIELGVGPNEIKPRLKAQAIRDTPKDPDTELPK